MRLVLGAVLLIAITKAAFGENCNDSKTKIESRSFKRDSVSIAFNREKLLEGAKNSRLAITRVSVYSSGNRPFGLQFAFLKPGESVLPERILLEYPTRSESSLVEGNGSGILGVGSNEEDLVVTGGPGTAQA